MNVLLNGERLTDALPLQLMNRGFRYGDGCFETILMLDGESPFVNQHQQRLKKSLQALHLEWPATLNLAASLNTITEGVSGWQRVRLWVWRRGGGLYGPEGTESDWMLFAEETQPPAVKQKSKVALSENIQLCPSPWSFVKSLSALPYVMAGQEKAERQLDELILLNQRGEVCEASASNLFFKKRKRWFTPALSTGCVAGVMRSWIMLQMLQKGEPVYEVHALPEELHKLDKLVCTNVSGLYPIAQLDDTRYDTDVEELWQLLPSAYREK